MTDRRRWTEIARSALGRRPLRIGAGLCLALAAGAVLPWHGWGERTGASVAQENQPDAAARARTEQARLSAQAALRNAQARVPEEVPVFSRADFQSLVAEIGEAFREGRPVEGDVALQQAVARWPKMHAFRVALAQLRARQGRLEEAEIELKAAAEAGFREPDRIETSPVFAELRARPAFDGILEQMRGPAPEREVQTPVAIPTPIDGLIATVSEANSEWSQADGVVRALFALPPPDERGPIGVRGEQAGVERLNRLIASGEAASNRGDFYENLDDDHAILFRELFPDLLRIEHAPEVRAQGYGYGLARGLAISADAEQYPPLIGNASLAMTAGSGWRSMARLALTRPRNPQELWRQYVSNQLYFYPEHNDHDGFHGDVFPANTPYMIVSQGSSGSEMTAMRAVAMILAAFTPETKAELIRRRMVSPVVQMIWRRGQKGVESLEDYYSPLAHPTVFDREMAESDRMVEMANALRPEQIPPLPTLKVIEETQPTPGISVFGDGLTQAWFDTPAAISRLFRTTDRTLTMTVAAAALNPDPKRPASFRWQLLRGDPSKVRITPTGERGEQARIEVDWHEGVEAPPRGLRSHRIDIAVFAEAEGAAPSAPAFVSVAFPPRQEREYDARGRIKVVSYDGAEPQAEYADPWLWPERGWRDIYQYDAEGRPDGWRRGPTDGYASERYTRHGAAVYESDAQGRPLKARIMAYPIAPENQVRKVLRRAGDHILVYGYDGPDDLTGYATPQIAEPAAKPLRNPTR